MSATAVSAVAAPPRDLTADLAPVAARVPMPHSSDPTLDEEGHDDPTPHPSEDPGMDGDPHGMEPVPSDDPHGGMEDPTRDEEMASGDPMDMGGHGAESSPSTAPGHGHGAEPSPEMSPAPADSDGHGSMSDMDDQEMASHEPADDGHAEEDDAAVGHEDASGGHDDGDDAAAEGERPRGVVLGGFVAINGLVLGAAALTRRRDRAAAALKARRTSTTSKPEKDASR
jgi:hypothetical protein